MQAGPKSKARSHTFCQPRVFETSTTTTFCNVTIRYFTKIVFSMSLETWKRQMHQRACAETLRLVTSCRVAGVLDTRCTHSRPSSVHSRGGSTLSSISSVCWLLSDSPGGSLGLGGLGTGPPAPAAAMVDCWLCLERICDRESEGGIK